jgi:hypothetical protein
VAELLGRAVKVEHEVSEVVKGFSKDIALESRGEWSLKRYTSPTGASKRPIRPNPLSRSEAR